MRKLNDVIATLLKIAGSSRILGKSDRTSVVVKTGPDRIRPIRTIGVDAGGTVVIVLEEEGEVA